MTRKVVSDHGVLPPDNAMRSVVGHRDVCWRVILFYGKQNSNDKKKSSPTARQVLNLQCRGANWGGPGGMRLGRNVSRDSFSAGLKRMHTGLGKEKLQPAKSARGGLSPPWCTPPLLAAYPPSASTLQIAGTPRREARRRARPPSSCLISGMPYYPGDLRHPGSACTLQNQLSVGLPKSIRTLG